jgi:hypothetical protein
MSYFVAIGAFSMLIWYFGSSQYFWVLAWPGTVVHEFMHWLVGLVTLGNPVSFDVFPKPPTAEGQLLGSVEFSNVGWWNALPIGIAPILALPIAIGIASRMHFEFTWTGCFIAWILASVIGQCWPSGADWRIVFKYKTGLLFYGGLVYLAIR